MEIKIGVANVARELVVDTDLTPTQIEQAVSAALGSDGVFRIEDTKGRVVMVPGTALGYVDIGEHGKNRVGFS